jgi:hypothetical protein
MDRASHIIILPHPVTPVKVGKKCLPGTNMGLHGEGTHHLPWEMSVISVSQCVYHITFLLICQEPIVVMMALAISPSFMFSF